VAVEVFHQAVVTAIDQCHDTLSTNTNST